MRRSNGALRIKMRLDDMEAFDSSDFELASELDLMNFEKETRARPWSGGLGVWL